MRFGITPSHLLAPFYIPYTQSPKTRTHLHHLILQVLPHTPRRAARISYSGRRCARGPSRAACCASATTRQRSSTASSRDSTFKRLLWQCPSSAPVPPRGAPAGSGQLNTPRGKGWATGRPATGSNARARRLHSRRFRGFCSSRRGAPGLPRPTATAGRGGRGGRSARNTARP